MPIFDNRVSSFQSSWNIEVPEPGNGLNIVRVYSDSMSSHPERYPDEWVYLGVSDPNRKLPSLCHSRDYATWEEPLRALPEGTMIWWADEWLVLTDETIRRICG